MTVGNSRRRRFSQLNFLKSTLKRILESRISPLKIIWKGSSRGKKIALTFDDGPDPIHTPQILEILSELDVVATFFLLGYKAEKHISIVKEIVARGHEIGNHSFDHNRFQAEPMRDFHSQIEKTNQLLKRMSGIEPRIFRPPFGILHLPLLLYCMKKQIKIVMWSLDCRDSFELGFDYCSHRLENANENDIVLMHDDSNNSEKILLNELPILIENGFSFVSVSSMLAD